MRYVLLMCLLLAGCGPGPAAPASDDQAGPEEVEPVLFEHYFGRLELLDTGTGLPGLFDDAKGYRFSRKAALRVSASVLRPATLRLVVRSRTTGEASLGIARTVTPGDVLVDLGRFPGDIYELHVLVGESLVKLIAFAAE